MTIKNNATIYYEPEGFTITNRQALMGRHAAGESFLRAMALFADVDALECFTLHKETAQQFARQVGSFAPARKFLTRWINPENLAAIQHTGCLFLPEPGLSDAAWQRRHVGQRLYSLCGVTHTTASHTVMDEIAQFLTSPVQPWDALICTSAVVKDTVMQILQAQGEFLSNRLGASSFVLPQLPVIPLGVHCDDFCPDETVRHQFRKRLDIETNDIVVLFMGRLSFHAKAHPIAMFRALEEAVVSTTNRVHLVLAGWFANQAIESAFREAAQRICPSIHLIVLDGRDTTIRREVWQGADIFCSLADNIQETFGLTPVEAMAAGLPCVVSDWNGYKGTVRDGIDGFRIPTLALPGPLGEELAWRYATGIDSYDMYCGYSCQFVAVDIPACRDAFQRLFDDADLRKRMGADARKRAREVFDWRIIIGQYQQLWNSLACMRQQFSEVAPHHPESPVDPRRQDPFRLFASYPSSLLCHSQIVSLVCPLNRDQIQILQQAPFLNYAKDMLPSPELCQQIQEQLGVSGEKVENILQLCKEYEQEDVARCLVWLYKVGIINVSHLL